MRPKLIYEVCVVLSWATFYVQVNSIEWIVNEMDSQDHRSSLPVQYGATERPCRTRSSKELIPNKIREALSLGRRGESVWTRSTTQTQRHNFACCLTGLNIRREEATVRKLGPGEHRVTARAAGLIIAGENPSKDGRSRLRTLAKSNWGCPPVLKKTSKKAIGMASIESSYKKWWGQAHLIW